MAGSLIKWARKQGVSIPNLGSRPSRPNEPTRARAPACAAQYVSRDGALESDESLAILGKLAIRHVAAHALSDADRVKAGQLLVAIGGQTTADPSAPLVSLTLNAASSQDLDRLESEARQVLSASQTETRQDE